MQKRVADKYTREFGVDDLPDDVRENIERGVPSVIGSILILLVGIFLMIALGGEGIFIILAIITLLMGGIFLFFSVRMVIRARNKLLEEWKSHYQESASSE